MYNLISQIRIIILLAIFILGPAAYARTFQTSDNRFIGYTDIGQGRPIVLIHAFPTDRRLWELATQDLEDALQGSNGLRIISLDLWGFGQSSSANGQAITMVDYAREVNELLNHLQIQQAVIGGESMGGYITLAFLASFPEKVEGLILSNTQSIADSLEAKANREATAKDVLEHGTENLINGFMSKALSPTASEKTKLFLKHILERQDKMAIASALRGMALRPDTSDILTNSPIPILILSGEKDVLISPQQSENMHKLAKHSKLVLIPDAGHLASLEQPKQWMQAVVAMFSYK
ncbi:lipolytic protein [Legionella beliardensis]|uniref:Lipolytic protein n=1 Tax=Legionella beliardensis TaxID=91822 RepID=A0A378I785_9GAMM|nr:alpha/beta hydrolase [Legionella beliardensis]STX28284.1 lipolytic protein [Legionella beliardensis]